MGYSLFQSLSVTMVAYVAAATHLSSFYSKEMSVINLQLETLQASHDTPHAQDESATVALFGCLLL